MRFVVILDDYDGIGRRVFFDLGADWRSFQDVLNGQGFPENLRKLPPPNPEAAAACAAMLDHESCNPEVTRHAASEFHKRVLISRCFRHSKGTVFAGSLSHSGTYDIGSAKWWGM